MENQTNATKAQFQFRGYLITQSVIRVTGENLGENMNFGIDPKGLFSQNDKVFTLTMDVNVSDEKKNLELNMQIQGFFHTSSDDFEQVKSFLGLNAPAILFPYIRAYVTNLTALGGGQPIIIPTLNMSAIGQELIKNIEII